MRIITTLQQRVQQVNEVLEKLVQYVAEKQDLTKDLDDILHEIFPSEGNRLLILGEWNHSPALEPEILLWMAGSIDQQETFQSELGKALSDDGNPVWVHAKHMVDDYWKITVFNNIPDESDAYDGNYPQGSSPEEPGKAVARVVGSGNRQPATPANGSICWVLLVSGRFPFSRPRASPRGTRRALNPRRQATGTHPGGLLQHSTFGSSYRCVKLSHGWSHPESEAGNILRLGPSGAGRTHSPAVIVYRAANGDTGQLCSGIQPERGPAAGSCPAQPGSLAPGLPGSQGAGSEPSAAYGPTISGPTIRRRPPTSSSWFRPGYERGSIILTCNKGFGEWGEPLCDKGLAPARPDRLLGTTTC